MQLWAVRPLSPRYLDNIHLHPEEKYPKVKD